MSCPLALLGVLNLQYAIRIGQIEPLHEDSVGAARDQFILPECSKGVQNWNGKALSCLDHIMIDWCIAMHYACTVSK